MVEGRIPFGLPVIGIRGKERVPDWGFFFLFKSHLCLFACGFFSEFAFLSVVSFLSLLTVCFFLFLAGRNTWVSSGFDGWVTRGGKCNKKFEVCWDGVGFSLDDEIGDGWAARLEDDGPSVFGLCVFTFTIIMGKLCAVDFSVLAATGYCRQRRRVCFVSLVSILEECA